MGGCYPRRTARALPTLVPRLQGRASADRPAMPHDGRRSAPGPASRPFARGGSRPWDWERAAERACGLRSAGRGDARSGHAHAARRGSRHAPTRLGPLRRQSCAVCPACSRVATDERIDLTGSLFRSRLCASALLRGPEYAGDSWAVWYRSFSLGGPRG